MASLGYKPTPIPQRIKRFFQETEGCWLWTGYLDRDGYGQFYVLIDGVEKTKRAHRAVYELFVGVIPIGYTLDHLCEVRNCVNPAHLKPATVRENTLRSGNSVAGINHRKTHCKRGHEFTPENTYTPKNRPSERHCKTCKAQRRRLWLQN